MTAFMTAFPVILVQPTCPGDQHAKGVQFQLTCHLYRESHKTQVWLCFLVLSLLSTSTSAAPELATSHLLTCLKSETLKNAIERSEAMLYAPLSSDVKENCKMISLRCYMSELTMVIAEEEIQDPKTHIFFDFNEKLPKDHPVDCPPCEAYSLKNMTVFLERLISLLQEINIRTT
ncbi:interleukin-15-like isoform X2 [Cyclopterus lumpus]|uniref:Interleukin n=1 Tax=Cyclopterus lumpus TaxID=8103 RepID=A0A8C2WNF1_CYCLU|nr:interleukin-15-like isoform X2 [Cyclopterus lumpus]